MKCTTGDCSLERGHDWVLVPQPEVVWHMKAVKLLWARPCDAFKWTSYAEWEARQPKQEITNEDIAKPGRFAGHTTEEWAEIERADVDRKDKARELP